MPSLLHEILVDIPRTQPGLLLRLLASAYGMAIPSRPRIRTEESTLNALVPTSYAADLVHIVEAEGFKRAIVTEVQLRSSEEKRYTWPVYAAAVRARHRCPTDLVVLTPSRQVARWAAERISLGGCGTITPLVIGPDEIPRVTSERAARRALPLAVLSAVAHQNEPDGLSVFRAAARVAMRRDDSQARIYYDLLVSRLSARARREVGNMIDLRKWRPLSKEGKQVWNEMKAEARALGHREGFEDGFEKAQFEALTEVLTVRFGALSAATKRRVASLDAERMPQLLRLALSAETLRDFLGALDD